ncbi:MAG: exodeoxyribonuclease V subunit gamma [Rubrivivax sp.]|nr:exodeoxyribonuclease V subunit gamma [Rubrivivax sp.]
MTEALTPGLLVLHGNRLEALAGTVFAWLARHPLAALEEEVVLVPSNGMAEWLKAELAGALGVCAATRVELPARFLWRAWRAVLGRGAVPGRSALDKQPLAWSLMALLPALVDEPDFAPIAGFLGKGAEGGDALRRLQLARQLADLFDQYQVYRADWLDDWARGDDALRGADGQRRPLPADQRWQPRLWRALLARLPAQQSAAARPALHRRFLQALHDKDEGERIAGLPRRLVLFGTTHIPLQTLQAVAALSRHVQVLLAVPNPCRFHWADLIEGRELLRAERRRQPLRAGRDLAAVDPADLHAHGHPLLAAWGRQARDFVRQLDAFDDAEAARQRFGLARVDLFDEGPGSTLLERLQAAVRDMLPLAEQRAAAQAPADDDRSIVFHVAHGPQREVEILHDQLLQLLAQPPGGAPLAPREVVVMVPDIASFAPAIRAVFGALPRGHARHIPWGIADLGARGRHPLLVALEWLLRLPQQRASFGEINDLLQVPALARRFGIAEADLPPLLDWAEGAGARWGLSAEHRGSLGLAACGDANTWSFGLDRLLMGYAAGALAADAADTPVEPYDEVGGLSAGLVGALAELLQAIERWWTLARQPALPEVWGERLRTLLAAFFAAGDDGERSLLAALDEALAQWLQDCEDAGLAEALDLAVVREAWLEAVDDPGQPGGARRFRAGGVTFCTLLPLRAVPFQVVCLLGMNDGDYPRRAPRSDFDLMALPGQARPGDRSRRDDDRQLMLDALLAARRVLYVSWAGRSVRDNSEQPPSVLVAQLRDHLAAVWGEDAVKSRTTEHPLQPFSRRYFEPGSGLSTYADEWRSAHEPQAPLAALAAQASQVSRPVPAAVPAALQAAPLSLQRLAAFLRNPVKDFFRHRLQVSFAEQDVPPADDEPFALDGLQRWQLLEDALQAAQRRFDDDPQADIATLVERHLARQRRAGLLPLAAAGRRVEAELAEVLSPMLRQWRTLLLKHPQHLDKHALRLEHPLQPGLVFDDWLTGLRAGEPAPLVIELQAGRIALGRKKDKPRPDRLVTAWLRALAAAAGGHAVASVLIGADAVATVAPLAGDEMPGARETLLDLMHACQASDLGDAPWPTALRTGLAWLDEGGRPHTVFEGSSRSPVPGEGREPCLARLYPDFEALRQDPGFEDATRRLYAAYSVWLSVKPALQPLEGARADDDEDDEAVAEGAEGPA